MKTIDKTIKWIAQADSSVFLNHPFVTITFAALIGFAVGTAFGLAT